MIGTAITSRFATSASRLPRLSRDRSHAGVLHLVFDRRWDILIGSKELKEIESSQKHEDERDERRFYSQGKNIRRHLGLQMDIDRHCHGSDESG